jgi:hypothetical protein
VRTWTARITNGHLPVRFNWVSYIYQLWASARYGIGAIPADEDELEGFLNEEMRPMLPSLGVNRNIRRGWRTIHRSFLGVGLYNFEIEVLIQRVNLFLQHFDSPYDLGITLRATMELVQLEAGFADCPFNHPYSIRMESLSLTVGSAHFGRVLISLFFGCTSTTQLYLRREKEITC